MQVITCLRTWLIWRASSAVMSAPRNMKRNSSVLKSQFAVDRKMLRVYPVLVDFKGCKLMWGSFHSYTDKMCDRKAVIKNADMSEEMQQDAVDCATQALEKFNIEKVHFIIFYFENLTIFVLSHEWDIVKSFLFFSYFRIYYLVTSDYGNFRI